MSDLPRERGSVTVEAALVVPVVMVVALGLLQLGLWIHTQHVLLAAAQEGARAAAVDGGTAAGGRRTALALVRAGLGKLARSHSIAASVTAQEAEVRALVRLPVVVPFLPSITVSAHARAHRERFVPAGAPR